MTVCPRSDVNWGLGRFPSKKKGTPLSQLNIMNKTEGVSFERWIGELRLIARLMDWADPDTSISEEDWRLYYDDNQTPAGAMFEDCNA